MESHLFRLLSVPVLAPQSLGGGGPAPVAGSREPPGPEPAGRCR
jgi:hypothetical protein